MRGLSPVTASRDHSSSRCAGLSLSRPLLLRSTGSRHAGSVVVAHGPSRSAACGILPDQGSNPYPLHWQADSQPLRHQGSPLYVFKSGSNLGHSLWEGQYFLFILLAWGEGLLKAQSFCYCWTLSPPENSPLVSMWRIDWKFCLQRGRQPSAGAGIAARAACQTIWDINSRSDHGMYPWLLGHSLAGLEDLWI